MNKFLFRKLFKFYVGKVNYLRLIFWKSIFLHFGDNSRILGRIVVYYPENISIGSNSTLNEGVILNARAKISIGNHVHISPGVILNTGGLVYEKILSERSHEAKEIKIHDGAWIGSGAIINPGVEIGLNSVIGSGSVVTKKIAGNAVAVGVPAKKIKNINVKF